MSATTYPFDLLTQSTSNPLSSLASGFNTLTGGAFWLVALFSVLLVALMILIRRGYRFSNSLMTSCIIAAISSVFLNLAGLVSGDYVIFLGILSGVMTLWVYLEGD